MAEQRVMGVCVSGREGPTAIALVLGTKVLFEGIDFHRVMVLRARMQYIFRLLEEYLNHRIQEQTGPSLHQTLSSVSNALLLQTGLHCSSFPASIS